ncbi:helix-turn-helix domain-containing protein [Limnoglobus roseus]|uniref:Transcriptional regulator n=1 Tax=Limnoglobus roseus TaxID=2598579 RepID=A0A5C1ACF2_9BACT|nr:helix-turn-helix domain-containing protein [Limnoglobus roseus]QEL16420.1 transcriptional regulator [Limnoglobus roseus]
MSAAEIKVWFVLFRDSKHDASRTSQMDIARRAGVNVRTVRRAFDGLKRAGLL